MKKTSPKKPDNKPNHQGALAAALLAVIATAVGITVAYQNSDLRNEVDSRAKKLGKQFNKNRATVQKNVMEIFGKVSEELEKNYLEVHSHVMAAVDQLQTLAKDNQKNIDQAIEQIITNFAKAKKWSKQNAEKFTEMLKAEWVKQSKATAKPLAKIIAKKAPVKAAKPQPKKAPVKKPAKK